MAKKPIVKLTYTLFCFQDDAETAREALSEAFDECDADLYGGTSDVTPATPQEDAEARPELEEMSGDLFDEDEEDEE